MKRREALQAKDEKRTPRTLYAWDFLIGVQDLTRQGALRFRGIMKRSIDGTASSAQARETGMRARGIAEAAWRQVEAHFPAGSR